QRVHDLLDALHDLGEAGVEVVAPVELHLHHGQALPRPRLDIADARHRGDRLLDGVGDGALDVLDVGALVDGADPDGREVDVGEEIHRRPAERRRAEEHDRERAHEDRDPVPHGDEGQPHTGQIPVAGTALTFWPVLTRSLPCTITESVSLTPLVISTHPPSVTPRSTGTNSTAPARTTTSEGRPSPTRRASTGTASAPGRRSTTSSTRANMPGLSRPSPLGMSTSTPMVRERGSRACTMRVTVPLNTSPV